jgi:hypothetical protein
MPLVSGDGVERELTMNAGAVHDVRQAVGVHTRERFAQAIFIGDITGDRDDCARGVRLRERIHCFITIKSNHSEPSLNEHLNAGATDT